MTRLFCLDNLSGNRGSSLSVRSCAFSTFRAEQRS
jgi:hypothetical protein